jgi:hypothetical protein
MTSSFWKFRVHTNLVKRDKLHLLPFHSWNCITLQINDKTLNLVIKDEKKMALLLKFLIYSLRTVDGRRSSADKLLQSIRE